ncbi:MAG: RNA methyltransferase [Flavobacteriaceae bacterium]|jgi:RNA methyltransferase, TrmH family|nr:RNA methyltransferase [Flavobacteriaceae bacterium]|tara:strand:+ start:5472 stop:6191 length:720 start_codon:yes stop_codon:yes gene_type:complete
MRLSNNHQKLITSLSQKKYRQKHQLFIAEGVKVIEEFLKSSYEVEILFSTDPYFSFLDCFVQVTNQELKKISSLKTPNKVLALFKIPSEKKVNSSGLIVALDTINDPGNLGTIIRLCDWFGVEQLVCSKETVDCYNTKVVQASMGSLTRVSTSYLNLPEYLKTVSIPIYIADMNGVNIHKTKLPASAVLVMGNEANGISDTLKNLISNKISIPRYGDSMQVESLNVATATAILLNEFRR